MNISKQSPKTRILINTIILYFQLAFTIVVNLYSTRLILNAMGVEDFGVVNLVSGIVAMLSFFQNSMTISTQRFLSVNMGRKDISSQLQIFNTSIIIHLLLGLALVVVLESITPLIFNSAIQIPSERLVASQLLYQLTIFGTLCVVLSVPYDATLNAHENMLIYSIACIIESAIRLLGAIILVGYNNDKLVFYGFLLITIRLVSLLIKFIYCRKNYIDAQLDIKKFSGRRLREMLAFAGWNMVGGFSVSLRSQGMAVVLNIFQGVVINAAYGIANQIAGQLTNFTATLTKAMAPQIMQSKGAGDDNYMKILSIKQCKFSFILLLFMVIPLYVEMPLILRLWLKQIPEYGVSFCRLILIVSAAQQVTIGIQTLIQANGKIALYQTVMSVLILLNIPAAYFVLKMGFDPNFVIIAMLIVEVVCLGGRILLANKVVNLSLNLILRELIVPVSLISLFAIIITSFCLLLRSQSEGLLTFIITVIVSFVLHAIISFVTLSKNERSLVVKGVMKIINHFIK